MSLSQAILRTLNAKCSRKWAVPFVLSVSAREPASIQMPTVDVCAHGECSVAICMTHQPLLDFKPLVFFVPSSHLTKSSTLCEQVGPGWHIFGTVQWSSELCSCAQHGVSCMQVSEMPSREDERTGAMSRAANVIDRACQDVCSILFKASRRKSRLSFSQSKRCVSCLHGQALALVHFYHSTFSTSCSPVQHVY